MTKLSRIYVRLNNPVFRNTLIYTTSGALNAAIPFFLLPFLTEYLTPKEYGIASTFTVFNSIFMLLIGLEQQSFISVNFFRESKSVISQYVSNVLISSFTVFLLLFGGILLVSLFTDSISQIPSKWVAFSVLVALFQFFFQLLLTMLQLGSKAISYGLSQVLNSAISYGVSILLIIKFAMESEGRIWGIAIAAFSMGFVSLWILVRLGYLSLKFDWQIVKSSIMFSLPLVPHGVAGWVNTGSDRLIINSYSTLTDSGVYSTGYQIAFLISLIASAFNKAFVPYIYKTLENGGNEGKKRLVRYTYYYYIVILILTLLLAYFSDLVLQIFAGKAYASAQSYILWIAIGFAADALYYGVINYIFYSRRTSLISVITFGSCILHFVLSLFFISRWGAIGAAYSTTISYIFTFAVSWWVSNKVYPMPWFTFR